MAKVLPATCGKCREIFCNAQMHVPKALFIWRKSLPDFRAAQLAGCPMCLKFEEWFQKEIYEASADSTSSMASSGWISLWFNYRNLGPSGRIIMIYPRESTDGRFLSYQLLTSQDDPVAHHVLARPPDRQIASDANLNLAIEWLRDCDSNHTPCVKLGTSMLPSRVIDVSQTAVNDEIRLVESRHQPRRYAALSYCWGTAQTSITTLSNIKDRTTVGVPLSIFPQTIQDAVNITRKLGLQYLWVDAICILQDSPEDKLREIGQMDKIYRSAYVTISAANSTDCHQGFLQERPDMTGAGVPPIYLPYTAPDGSRGIVGMYMLSRRRVKDAITARAWTMQEYLLSPRLLIFGTLQMSCICRTRDELGIVQAAFGNALDNNLWKPVHQLLSPQSSGAETNKEATWIKDLPFSWSCIMEEYSSRQLTHSSDKILAMSGIASVFATYTQDDYIVGHWRQGLLTSLLWKCAGSCSRIAPNSQIPSWSWLSIDGVVKGRDRIEREQEKPARGVEIVKATSVPEAGHGLYGSVKNVVLELRGHLTKVRLHLDNSSSTASPYKLGSSVDSVARITISLDHSEALLLEQHGGQSISADTANYYCLPLTEYRSKPSSGPVQRTIAHLDHFRGGARANPTDIDFLNLVASVLSQNNLENREQTEVPTGSDDQSEAAEGLLLDLTQEGAYRIGTFSCNRTTAYRDGAFNPDYQGDFARFSWLWQSQSTVVSLK